METVKKVSSLPCQTHSVPGSCNVELDPGCYEAVLVYLGFACSTCKKSPGLSYVSGCFNFLYTDFMTHIVLFQSVTSVCACPWNPWWSPSKPEAIVAAHCLQGLATEGEMIFEARWRHGYEPSNSPKSPAWESIFFYSKSRSYLRDDFIALSFALRSRRPQFFSLQLQSHMKRDSASNMASRW